MSNKYDDELSFMSLSKILLSKKWLFIITFIIIAAVCLAYLFLRPEEYSIKSKIKVSESFIYSNNELYDYFPEDTEKLWIFATHRQALLEEQNIDRIISELVSGEIAGKTANELQLDPDIIKDSNNVTKTDDMNILITTTFNNAEDAIKINQALLNVYTESKKNEFEGIYNTFLQKITDRLDQDSNDMETLIDEKGSNDAEYRNEISKAIESRDTNLIAEKLSNMESLTNKITKINTEYNFLVDVKNNLETNKDFFINRIEVLQEPDIDNVTVNASLKRNIVYSIVTAIVIAFIITLIAGLYSHSRSTARHSK